MIGLDDDPVELDFIALLENRYPQDIFERSVNLILGEDWKEMGEEILVSEGRKDLMESFKEYASN